ncbi:FAS1-like dehydratase domain-containing protein [Ktedonobacter robiniae]|uniref:FAS1-like dehydratase domain-containing protein n=1 Tax=Ktedonobacter robiniae TaxID=2778365 RepID=A0ABQ3UYV6_9CHLR|nr:MaoC family dehydratase N-terminal domain-containing protein [Ktedonobacter robiniae]GHO57885.1 hypothetical protein KSB_63600 [Ktedonobacter robiniae]
MFDTNKVGHSFPPFTITVEPANIRDLARTSGDDNPIYQYHRKAQQVGSLHIPLFPTAGMLFHFWENTPFVEHLAELGLDVAQLMYREESYEYLVPPQDG